MGHRSHDPLLLPRACPARNPRQTPRAITKPVALILLAHYVGDIHQPLHVGAEYFDNGKFANPDTDKNALPDQGGNTFVMDLAEPPNYSPERRPSRAAARGCTPSGTATR